MQEWSDAQLLRDYAASGREAAFRELVARYTDLVYSAAARQVESPDAVADVAQSVLVDLARKAGAVSAQMAPEASLAGWLHRATRYAALNDLRNNRRRLTNERQAMEQILIDSESPADWEHIRPLLDEALDSLEPDDREAVLLRYFKNQDFRVVGRALGVSDDAAQKRVSRAVERLREFFSKHKITVGAGALAALLTANAVQAAPAGLAAAICTAIGVTVQPAAMTLIAKALLATLAVTVIGLGLHDFRGQRQLAVLRQEQATLAAQVAALTRERDLARQQLTALQAENDQLRANELELLKLRAEVTRLRAQANQPREASVPPAPAPRWTNWNNRQSIGSFYAVAGTSTETVAVGVDGRIATRNNTTGIWKILTFTGDPDFRAIVYANSQYVVVRESGSIMTSPDSLAWTSCSSPTHANLLGLYWDGHQFLAGGDKGTILASLDGITWTQCQTDSGISIYGFSCSGARYVAVGNDGILVSSDAVAWTPAANAPSSVPFTACIWTGSEFLACGLGLDKNPTIYTSPDGDVWTLREHSPTASLRAAIFINGVIYVAGDSVIARSADGGATWENIFPKSGGNRLFMGLASNGQSLIAAGFNQNVWALPVPPTP